MKLILRILICSLSITMANQALANETEEASPIAVAVDAATTPEAAPKTLTLDPDYVQLTLTSPNLVSLSVLDTFKNLTESVQKKFYSLLNWKMHERTTDLEITNYSRTLQFGRWINDPADETCFNTRAKVLVRDSVKNVVFHDRNHCLVQKGDWVDPYTTTTIKESRAVQIDHLVPLKNAYLSGAYKWSFRERCLYANYMGMEFHLLSVDGIENMRKGDRSPATYMPPNREYSCTYVRNWLAVKILWGLTMSKAEASAIHQIIVDNKCALSNFRIGEKELASQRQFAKDNIDLCEKVDKSTPPTR